jgi:hypothetical protein
MSVNRDKLVNVLMEMPEVEPSRNLHVQIINKAKKVNSVAQLGVTVGEVYLKEKGTECWEIALPGDAVFEGDTLSTHTNGRTCINFKDGTQIWLNQNTQLEFTASTRKLSLPQGEILAFVQRLKQKGSNFILQTPVSRIEVLGTVFDAAISADDSCTLSVLKGSVRFFNDKGSVKLKPNMQSVADAHCGPSKPVATNLTPMIQWTNALVEKSEQQKHLNPVVLTHPRELLEPPPLSITKTILIWLGSGILGFILGWVIGLLTH